MQERDGLVTLSRRDAVKRVGAWVICAGGLAALPACGPQKTVALAHYKLTVDGNDRIFVDVGVAVDKSTRCTA